MAIQRLFEAYKGRYGAPRLVLELREEGWKVSRRRVVNRMRTLGLRARAARKYKATTPSKHSLPVAPNRVWVSDITYLWTGEGWLYLAVVLDLYSRTVVGWAMAERMTWEREMSALTIAVGRRRPPPGVVVHSDRGSQYASGDYQALLETHGFLCSRSRKGDGYDKTPPWRASFIR